MGRGGREASSGDAAPSLLPDLRATGGRQQLPASPLTRPGGAPGRRRQPGKRGRRQHAARGGRRGRLLQRRAGRDGSARLGCHPAAVSLCHGSRLLATAAGPASGGGGGRRQSQSGGAGAGGGVESAAPPARGLRHSKRRSREAAGAQEGDDAERGGRHAWPELLAAAGRRAPAEAARSHAAAALAGIMSEPGGRRGCAEASAGAAKFPHGRSPGSEGLACGSDIAPSALEPESL